MDAAASTSTDGASRSSPFSSRRFCEPAFGAGSIRSKPSRDEFRRRRLKRACGLWAGQKLDIHARNLIVTEFEIARAHSPVAFGLWTATNLAAIPAATTRAAPSAKTPALAYRSRSHRQPRRRREISFPASSCPPAPSWKHLSIIRPQRQPQALDDRHPQKQVVGHFRSIAELFDLASGIEGRNQIVRDKADAAFRKSRGRIARELSGEGGIGIPKGITNAISTASRRPRATR